MAHPEQVVKCNISEIRKLAVDLGCVWSLPSIVMQMYCNIRSVNKKYK